MGESRVALVTGAADGMGLALTRHLVQNGWRVAMCDMNEEQGKEHAEKLGASSLFVKVDVTDYDQQAQAFQLVWERWGQLDFVAANAGILDSFSIYDFPSQPHSTAPPSKPNLKTIEVNLTGVVYTIYLATYYLRQNPVPGGSINVTASSAALYALDSVPLYTASKSAIPGLVRSMAPRLKAHNIKINCLCPGLISTGLTEKLMRLVDQQYVTPIGNVIDCHQRLIDGDDTGCVAEVSKGKVYLRTQLDYADKYQKWVTVHLPELGRRARTQT